MGGYGLYVWGSYAVTAVLLALEVWLVMRRGRTSLRHAGHSEDAGDHAVAGDRSVGGGGEAAKRQGSTMEGNNKR